MADVTDRQRAVSRVHKLRAKAASTTFPAERDALNAKADELALAHDITPRDVIRAGAGVSIDDLEEREYFDAMMATMQEEMTRLAKMITEQYNVSFNVVAGQNATQRSTRQAATFNFVRNRYRE